MTDATTPAAELTPTAASTPDAAAVFLTPLARFFLVVIFLGSGVNKITNTPGTIEAMTGVGIPAPGLLVYGAIAFLLVGGLSVLLGAWTRIGTALLMIFLAMATYYFHDFWNAAEDAKQMQTIAFLKNLALLGGLLFLFANGPGPVSIDAWRATRATHHP